MVLFGFGISFYVEADIMSMPAEGVAQAISIKSGWQLSSAKIMFDWSVVAVSLLLCWLVLHRLDGIREGTLIAAFGEMLLDASHADAMAWLDWLKPGGNQ